MDLKEEEKLIRAAQRVKKGKENHAFGKLYSHYHPKIRSFFLKRAQPQHADDLASDVFVKALTYLSSFQWQGVPFSFWLYKISRNVLVDHYKSQSRVFVSIEDIPPRASEGHAEDLAISHEQTDLLQALLRQLPHRERRIVYLKFYEGYTNRVIAKITGLSETNVGTILYRTLQRLRRQI